MKILRIALKDIASIAGAHEIDFRAEPLRSAGLFAISGPTGAGKSTILDAICLALFDEVPRLNGAASADINGIQQNNPQTLFRRGTTDAYAEVDFLGTDGQEYRARWQVRRAHGKTEGNVLGTEISLTRLADGQRLGGKKTETLPLIKEKLGFSYDQFIRAVILAQNQFAEFLKSKDADRAQVLEALTGTGRFGGISRAIFERNKIEQEKITALQNKLGGITPLDTEARAAAEADVAAARAALIQADTAKAVIEKHLDWRNRIESLDAEINAADAVRAEKQTLLDDAEPRRRLLRRIEQAHTQSVVTADTAATAAAVRADKSRTDFDNAGTAARAAEKAHVAAETAAADARKKLQVAKDSRDALQPAIQQARKLDIRLESLVAATAAAAKTLQTETAGSKNLREQRDAQNRSRAELAQKQETLQARLEQRAALAPFLADLPAWQERFAQAAADSAKANAAAGALAVARQKTQAADVAVAESEKRGEPLDAAVQAAARSLDAAGTALAAFDAEALEREHVALTARRTRLSEIKTAAADSAAVTEARDAQAAALEAANIAFDILSAKIKNCEAVEVPEAEAAHAAAQKHLEKIQSDIAAIADDARRLREKLVPDMPCPVCGSTGHPYHAADLPQTDSALLKKAREDAAAAVQKVATLQAELKSGKAAIAEKMKSLEKLKNDFASIVQKFQSRQKTLAEWQAGAAASGVLPLIEGEIPAALATRAEEALAGLEPQITAVAKRKQQCLDAGKAVAAARKNHADATGAFEQWQRSHQSLAQSAREAAQSEAHAVTQADAAANAARKCHDALRPELLAFAFSLKDAERTAGNADVTAATADAFAVVAKNYIADAAAHEVAKNQIARLDATLAQLDAQLAAAEKRQTDAAAAHAEAFASENVIRAERKKLFDGNSADVVEKAANDAVVVADTIAAAAGKKFADTQAVHISAKDALAGARRDLGDATTAATQAANALDAVLAATAADLGTPLTREELREFRAKTSAEIEREKIALQVLVTDLAKAGAALDTLRRQREGHCAVAGKLPSLPVVAGEFSASAVQGSTEAPTEPQRSFDSILPKVELVALQAGFVRNAEESKDAHARKQSVLLADDNARVAAGKIAVEIAAAENTARPWGELNELLGSREGQKFRDIAQRHTLKILLRHANAQLTTLTRRYQLEALLDSLNLIVVDNEMAGERRSVFSLSGGESFLVSLSLALGLASLASNRLRIESLFIDEGFGSLDAETLSTALDALMRLESQGRKVGIISHVVEMTEKIPVQIQIRKSRSGGASKIEVDGRAVALVDAEAKLKHAAIREYAEKILAVLRAESGGPLSSVSLNRQFTDKELRELALEQLLRAAQIRHSGKSYVCDV